MYNMASNHSTSLGIPRPHFTSCITAHPHSTAHHHIAHILHHTLFHIPSHIWHCKTFHITPNSTPHYSTSCHMMCDLVVLKCCEMWYGVLCRKCGLMWNIVELWWWDVEYITLPLQLTPHHIIPLSLQCIIPHQTPSRTLFQTTPHSRSHHHSSPYRTYSTLHLIPHHSRIRMNKAQHPTSGIAKHNTSHRIPQSLHVMCDLVASWNYEMWDWCGMVRVLCRKCGLMWNIVELWWWNVECIIHCHCISHLITSLPPHFTDIASFHIKHHLSSLTLFQTAQKPSAY